MTSYAPCDMIFISPPPIDESKQRYRTNRHIKQYIQVIKDTADHYQCHFINLYQVFIQTDTPLSDLMEGIMDDGLHFGLMGYQLLANAILTYID